MEVLVHIDVDGRVFADHQNVSWLRVIDNRVYIAAHPKVVKFLEEDRFRAFVRAPLSYAPWINVEVGMKFVAALSSVLDANPGMLAELRGANAVGAHIEIEMPVDIDVKAELVVTSILDAGKAVDAILDMKQKEE